MKAKYSRWGYFVCLLAFSTARAADVKVPVVVQLGSAAKWASTAPNTPGAGLIGSWLESGVNGSANRKARETLAEVRLHTKLDIEAELSTRFGCTDESESGGFCEEVFFIESANVADRTRLTEMLNTHGSSTLLTLRVWFVLKGDEFVARTYVQRYPTPKMGNIVAPEFIASYHESSPTQAGASPAYWLIGNPAPIDGAIQRGLSELRNLITVGIESGVFDKPDDLWKGLGSRPTLSQLKKKGVLECAGFLNCSEHAERILDGRVWSWTFESASPILLDLRSRSMVVHKLDGQL